MKTKGVKQLKEELCEFERDIVQGITEELKRIGRTVTVDEFDFVPFSDEVEFYIEAIGVGGDGRPICGVSFRDIGGKHLSSFISDNEIDHWNMIALLESLQGIGT